MTKRDNFLRALDGAAVYMGVLIIAGLTAIIGYRFLGLWALYASEMLALALAFGVALKTGLKSSAWLKFKSGGVRYAVGGSLVFGGALLCAIPVLLFVQVIVPDFAVSSLHITDALEGHSAKYLHIILLIIISGVSECLIFEGYIYARLKGVAGFPKVALMIAGAYALYQLDLYTLIPLFVVELAILYVRKKTLSLVLPCVLHIISATLTLAVRDYATDSSQLLGTQMGALQVIGLAILFAGASLPVLAVGARLMGDLKNRSMLQKGLLVLFSLVLIASGYAISRI